MIAKKNPKISNEKNRLAFLQLGLFIGGSIILTAFTWRTPHLMAQKEQIVHELDIPVELAPKIEEEEEIKKDEVLDNSQDDQNQDQQAQQNVQDLSNELDLQKNKDKDPKPSVDPKPVDKIKIGKQDLPPVGEPPASPPVKFPDVEAEFIGGSVQMKRFIIDNANYPYYESQSGITGKVYVQFIVEKDGSISHVETLNSVSKGLDREAVRIIKSMPKWKPAEKDGEFVRSFMQIPINFTLE